jgi:hypothetical protein
MRAQGAAPEGGTSGQRLISDGNGRDSEAKNSAMQGDTVLDVIADINNEHRLAHESASKAVQHAIRCGELLIEQKGRLNHGEFMPWVEANCEFQYSTAARYMRAAKESSTGVELSTLSAIFESGRESKQEQHKVTNLLIDELRKTLGPPKQRRWRTRKQKLRAIEQAAERLRPLSDQQHILKNYQDCRKEVTRLQNKLLDAESDLYEAEAFLLRAAAQEQSEATP